MVRERYVLVDLLFNHPALEAEKLPRPESIIYITGNGHVEGMQILTSLVKNEQRKIDLISLGLFAASRFGYLAIVKLLCPLVDVSHYFTPRPDRSLLYNTTPLQAALLGFDKFRPGSRRKLFWRADDE